MENRNGGGDCVFGQLDSEKRREEEGEEGAIRVEMEERERIALGQLEVEKVENETSRQSGWKGENWRDGGQLGERRVGGG